MVMHHRKLRLVDPKCFDEMTHDEYLELLIRGKDRHDPPVDGKLCVEDDEDEGQIGIGGAGHVGGAGHGSGAGF